MPIPLSNGDFEGGTPWVFTGLAGITGPVSLSDGFIMVPKQGALMGFLELMNTSYFRAGTMLLEFTVSSAQEGYYTLGGWMANYQGLPEFFGGGARFIRITLDDVIWLDDVDLFVSGYRTWEAITSPPMLIRAGTHQLAIVPIHEPLSDYTDTPWDGGSSVAVFDDLHLVQVPGKTGMRLTINTDGGIPNGSIDPLAPSALRLVVLTGKALRLTING